MVKKTPHLLVGLLLVAGCASASGGSSGPTSSRDVLTAAQIAEAGPQVQTAWDAVEQLRPHFVRERPNPTTGVAAARVDPVVVYVDGVRRGGTGELRRIRVEQVEEIRYLRPSDAQTRYGMGHSSGVIEVILHGGA